MRWKKSRSASGDTGDLFCVFLPFLAKRTRTHLLVRFSIIRAFQQAFGKRVSYASFAPFILRLDYHPLPQTIIARIKRAKLFIFLRDHRHELFDDA
jgi:hypothetical protein